MNAKIINGNTSFQVELAEGIRETFDFVKVIKI